MENGSILAHKHRRGLEVGVANGSPYIQQGLIHLLEGGSTVTDDNIGRKEASRVLSSLDRCVTEVHVLRQIVVRINEHAGKVIARTRRNSIQYVLIVSSMTLFMVLCLFLYNA